MRVRYLYSACVVIETEDAKILCDPWFTQGAYDGAWYQYPPLQNPIETIGPVDLVWISHIHPDHYDPAFLRQYFAAYPAARLVTGPQEPPYLVNKMRQDGFRPEVVETLSLGDTDLLIVPNRVPGDPKTDLDSALAVRARRLSVVNMNDNMFQPGQIARLKNFCSGGRVDFALLPYSGAGPYPQTFAFADDAALAAASARKREQFLSLFDAYLAAFDPVRAMPFAGKYYLGGALAHLNPLRGVPDAVELLERHPGGRVFVLADGGRATYDLATGIASDCRTARYDPAAIAAHLRREAAQPFDYAREIAPLDGRHLPILPLLSAAKTRARAKVTLDEPYWLVIRPEAAPSVFALNLADDAPPKLHPAGECFAHLAPRLEITIDERYLFGLLTRFYHWNNAEIGSHYRSLRVPETYHPPVYHFLNMLQV